MGRARGQAGSCCLVADLPLHPSDPASHDAGRDARGADDGPLAWAQQVLLAEELPQTLFAGTSPGSGWKGSSTTVSGQN